MPRREIDGGLIGKDAHDVGTALDLPVQTLERIATDSGSRLSREIDDLRH